MGLAPSAEEQAEFRGAVGAHIYQAMLAGGALPDVAIERPLLDNSGLRSGPAALDHFRELKRHVDRKAPAYLKELMAKLAPFTDEPRVTGLLTLVVSVAIEMAFAASSSSSSSARAAGRGVVVEERLSELRNLAEEYLKRHRMHLSDERKLREDTERLEGQHWVNGAAFHVQMLIHLARLGQQSDGPIRAAIASYLLDLRALLAAYRRHKAATVNVSKRWDVRDRDLDLSGGTLAGYSVSDKELGKSVYVPLPEDTPPACERLDSSFCTEAYLDHVFANYAQITDMERYFSETLGNLPALIAESGTLPNSPKSLSTVD
ncbi:hypothetical protein AAFF_G00135840 [Aldrovandia affinis]|uniref:Uncharacterized protein n=1 Tax=Aldrovandia affinis TaxID=143900 RepID=A0AAD7W9A1_9TELE|nr:hypothetical protein AAFF_G00135840 [Aldrovandia affinis]